MRYDLVIIGGGPAGEKAATSAAYFNKRVALVDASGSTLEPWRAEELLRDGSVGATRVTATDAGSRAVHER